MGEQDRGGTVGYVRLKLRQHYEFTDSLGRVVAVVMPEGVLGFLEVFRDVASAGEGAVQVFVHESEHDDG